MLTNTTVFEHVNHLIWDKLVVKYKGMSQVTETKINMFVYQFELFKMQPKKTIKEMFSHFINITNDLNLWARPIPMRRWLEKSFNGFPKTNGIPRSPQLKKLKTLALDNLLGKLLTNEIHLREDEKEVQTKRGVAFKTINEELHSTKEESSEKDEDSMTMIAKGLKKIFK